MVDPVGPAKEVGQLLGRRQSKASQPCHHLLSRTSGSQVRTERLPQPGMLLGDGIEEARHLGQLRHTFIVGIPGTITVTTKKAVVASGTLHPL
jgi:hypothetical protein